MRKSNIEKPSLRYRPTPASRPRFFQLCITMSIALCASMAINTAHAADGLPGSGSQTELTADQKLQALIDAGIFSPAGETLTQEDEMTRALLRQKLAALLESAPSTGPLPDPFGTEIPAGIEMPILMPGIIEGLGDGSKFEGALNLEALAALMEKLSATGVLDDVVLPGTGNLDSKVSAQLAELLPSLWNETQREQQANDAYQEQLGGLDQNEFPYVAAGVVTPASSWPTALNATYNGRIAGALTDSTPVTGSVTMTVDFAQINSMVPNIPGSIMFDNGKGSASFNLVQMGGYIGNSMTGTYDGQAMTGFMKDGQFYGPAANEIAGKWDMSAGSVSGSGTYAAKR